MSLAVIKKAALFVTINILGFSVPALLFVSSVALNILPTDDPATAGMIRDMLFHGSTKLWMVCAVFSVAYFFLKGRAGRMFLWAPVAVPVIYGLSVLVS